MRNIHFYITDYRWDSLPIIQEYVKQKLGETPAPRPTDLKPKVESPSTPTIPKEALAVNTVTSAVEGERWDPDKQLDKLKSGVIDRLREQQLKQRSSTIALGQEADDPPPKITIDEGTH
jgi:hypothetical protein